MKWILEDWDVIYHAAITAVIMLLVVMLITRINGLRSFAKITPIDFAVTITIGSVINSTVISDSNSLVKGSIVIAILILMQTIFSRLKAKFRWFDKYAFNQPIFLMRDGEFLDDNIKATNTSRANILAKLRGSNIKKLEDVQAVILETTGDINVISGDKDIDVYIVSDVRINPEHDNITVGLN